MALRNIIWRIANHANKLDLGTYAQILELERKAKILE